MLIHLRKTVILIAKILFKILTLSLPIKNQFLKLNNLQETQKFSSHRKDPKAPKGISSVSLIFVFHSQSFFPLAKILFIHYCMRKQ